MDRKGNEGFVVEDGLGVLREIPLPRTGPHSIGRLVSNRCYVYPDAQVEDVADALREREDILALAVVDDEGRVLGIVVRQVFFGMMVRAYAREVYKKRAITEVITAAVTMRNDLNTFSVADSLESDLAGDEIAYYVLTHRDGTFSGIFSSLDLLIYLSRLTQEDIALARRLQARIVRERSLVVGKRFEFVATSQIAQGVGGDFYDVREYAPGRWVFAFCDVAGKGVAASIITSVLWGMMNVYDFNDGLADFIVRLNSQIARTFESERYVTGVFLEYDEAENRVRVCDLGHSHIYICRRGALRKASNLQTNLPVGVSPELTPRFSRFSPAQGDTLLLVTDGLLEQQNEAGSVFPFSVVAEVFAREGDRPVEAVAERINRDFHRFRGAQHLGDDVTVVLLRFVEQEVTL
ncbi:MAG: SpoIIE family protein phosphatase [Spirochaetaceae bacterium]